MQHNQIYTINYSQPEEYRFSLDSIFLAQRVNDWLSQNNHQPFVVADLCAGCGVVGLELLFHLTQRNSKIKSIDFIEVQSEYKSHFEKNKLDMLKLLPVETELELLIENYLQVKKSYDLIICNPPYFLPGTGRLSPSEFKNRCRFFMDSTIESLFQWIHQSLSKKGSAFVLVREDFKSNLLNSEIIGDVRGTKLIRLFHSSSSGG